MTSVEIASAFLAEHGRSLKDHGIAESGLGLSPANAAAFIRLAEDLQLPLLRFETWRWYVAERGRHTYWSSWNSPARPHQYYDLARDALAKTALTSSDIVVFELDEPCA
jgi:hypothetical protein